VALFGDGFYDWKTEEVTIFTPENLRALTVFAEDRKRLGFDNVTRFQAGVNRDSFSAGWPFIGGHYSIAVDGQWRVEQLARYAPGLEYRTAPFPPPAGGRTGASFTNGNFMVVPTAARCPEGAWAFIKFWSGIENPERAAELAVLGGWLPLTPAVVAAPAYQEYLRKYPQFRTFVDLLSSPNLQPEPPVPYTTFLSDRIKRADDMALRGRLTPEQALRELQIEVDRERARRKEFGYVD
jgi:multiple sugar transport system substrate-binding protein